MSFLNELKRRKVFRAGAAYVVMAWLVMQVVDVVLNNIEAPTWVFRALMLFLAVGFAVTLVLAWAFELTPEGVRKESGDSESAPITQGSNRRLSYFAVGVLVLAASYFFVTQEQPASDSAVGIDGLIARPSVIVLPFVNISGDEEHDYLAFGITDELITGLQRLGNFPVVSRNASLSYGATDVSAINFAQNHEASYLVEGSVNVGSDGIRVLANLSGAGGNQVWAERYQLDEGQNDIFDVSDELVSKVAGAVLESEVQRVQRINRPPSDAWEHYMKGLRVVLAYDYQNYDVARQHLDLAIDIDPNMAEAWWALGELETMRYMTTPFVQENELDSLNTLIDYFRKAHELSPFHAAACGCLGYILTAVGRSDEARVVFDQAIDAKPLAADLRVDYAIYLAWQGQYEKALENADLALKLGPVPQDRAAVWTIRSLAALADGNEQEALDSINRATFIKKHTFYTPTAVAMLQVLGKHDAAALLFQDMQSMFPDLQPGNRVFYVTLKPIDDSLKARRENGNLDGPTNVEEIFSTLRAEVNDQSN